MKWAGAELRRSLVRSRWFRPAVVARVIDVLVVQRCACAGAAAVAGQITTALFGGSLLATAAVLVRAPFASVLFLTSLIVFIVLFEPLLDCHDPPKQPGFLH